MRKKFWSGRNGSDALSMALSLAACAMLVASIFIRGLSGTIVWLLAFFCLALSYYRIFSKKLSRRQAENQWFLQKIAPLTGWWRRRQTRRRQKNLYSFFGCPQCGTVLRVPKGKGHIRITCKCCGHVFERNS